MKQFRRKYLQIFNVFSPTCVISSDLVPLHAKFLKFIYRCVKKSNSNVVDCSGHIVVDFGLVVVINVCYFQFPRFA